MVSRPSQARFLSLCGILFAALIAGCQAGQDTETASGHLAPSDVASSDGSGASSSRDALPSDAVVELVTVTPEQFQQRIQQQNGKVVLVDFWATWCEPCREQFPHTIGLAAKYADDVHVITVSADDPADPEGAREFLQQQQATETENLLTALDLNETFDRFDIRGGIPFYKLYDRQGNLRYEFNGNPQRDDNTEPIDNLEVRLKELIEEMNSPDGAE